MEHPEDSQLQTTDGFPLSLVSRFKGVAKGWVPNIVPLITIFAALPYLLFLSLIAGWLIWSRVPTGWSAPIYLRYGCVCLPGILKYLSHINTSSKVKTPVLMHLLRLPD